MKTRRNYRKMMLKKNADTPQVSKDISIFEKFKLMSGQKMSEGKPQMPKTYRRRRHGFQGFKTK